MNNPKYYNEDISFEEFSFTISKNNSNDSCKDNLSYQLIRKTSISSTTDSINNEDTLTLKSF